MRKIKSCLKVIAINFLFVGIGILLFFWFCDVLRNNPAIATANVLFEKLARIAYRSSHPPVQYLCGRHDPDLAYVLVPGACRFADTEFDTLMHFNSAGLRDDEESLDNPDTVVVGDSHSMGLGVQREQIFAERLEDQSGRKVLNVSVSSYGTAREFKLLRKLRLGSAKHIIIQYCRNDFEENQAFLENDGRLHIMSEKAYAAIVKEAKGYRHSFVAPGMAVLNRVVEKATEGPSSWSMENGPGKDEVAAFRFVLLRNMDLLKGKTVIILDINGHNRYDNRFIERAKPALAGLGLDLHFVDVSKVLTDGDYYTLDTHMTSSGHAKVAAAILDTLRALNPSR
jgi:hypothetical protein